MKKTIYLHIGIGKTGTSSIQKFLYLNRDKLLDDNTLYPLSGIQNYAHFKLAELGQESFSEETLSLYNDLLEEIKFQKNINKIILSTEAKLL